MFIIWSPFFKYSSKSKFNGFENLSAKDNKNILKIIGILIDNSIESSIETNEKYLSIEICMNAGIFKMEIVNFIASDTHSPSFRPPMITDALSFIEEKFGKDIKDKLIANSNNLFTEIFKGETNA